MLVAHYKTKKALKARVLKPDCFCQAAPLTLGAVLNAHAKSYHRLHFSETSLFGVEYHPETRLTVVGPSAHERKWYANVWTDAHDNIVKVS